MKKTSIKPFLMKPINATRFIFRPPYMLCLGAGTSDIEYIYILYEYSLIPNSWALVEAHENWNAHVKIPSFYLSWRQLFSDEKVCLCNAHAFETIFRANNNFDFVVIPPFLLPLKSHFVWWVCKVDTNDMLPSLMFWQVRVNARLFSTLWPWERAVKKL